MGTAVVNYTAAALSDRGRKRASNEDAFSFSIEHGAYVVCDGMGGAAAGEIASSLAADEILRLLSRRAAAAAPRAAIEDAISAANETIYSRAQKNRKLSGMGTTLVGLVAEEGRAWVFNVGDSRCYRLRNRRLEQLTLDHSLVEEQVRLGQMTHAESIRSPFRNVITRAVGSQSSVRADIFEHKVEAGDLFLLCSDGLIREVSDAQIESLLGVDSPLEALCVRLVKAANKAGGEDNITCLLVRAGGKG